MTAARGDCGGDDGDELGRHDGGSPVALLSSGGAHLLDDAGQPALSLGQPDDVLLEGFPVGFARGLSLGAVGASLHPEGFPVGAGFGPIGGVSGDDEGSQCEADRDDGDGFLAELEHGSFHPRAFSLGGGSRPERDHRSAVPASFRGRFNEAGPEVGNECTTRRSIPYSLSPYRLVA